MVIKKGYKIIHLSKSLVWKLCVLQCKLIRAVVELRFCAELCYIWKQENECSEWLDYEAWKRFLIFYLF